MATKSSIHIQKPYQHRIRQAHNRKDLQYMQQYRGVRESMSFQTPTDNKRWINPDFRHSRTAELTYEAISSKWSGKDRTCHAGKGKGTQREKMERLSRWRDAHPSVKGEYCLSDRTPHWLMYANSVKSAKDAGASLRYRFSCIKTKGHWLNGQPEAEEQGELPSR